MPENWRRLGWNSAWLLAARVLSQGLGVVAVAVAARRLGVAAFGQYTLLTAAVMVGNVVTTFGTDILLIREVAGAGALTARVPAALAGQLLLTVVFWLGGVLVTPASLQPAAAVYLAALFPLTAYSVATILVRAAERMDWFAFLSVAQAAWPALGAVLLLRSSADLEPFGVWLWFGQALLAAGAGWIGWRIWPDLPRFIRTSPAEVWDLGRAAWPLALLTGATVAAQRLSLFQLGALGDAPAAGVYGAAARLVEGAKLGHYAILGALLPWLARRLAARPARLITLGLVALSLGLMLGLQSVGPWVLDLFYGAAYAPAHLVLIILALSLAPYGFNAFASLNQVMQGRAPLVLGATLAGLGAAALSGWLLIPAYGAAGAAWAAVLSESVQAAGLWLGPRLRPAAGAAAETR